MKKQRWSQWTALLLGMGMALTLWGCLLDSGSDGGAAATSTTVKTEIDSSSGEATAKALINGVENTFVVVDESGNAPVDQDGKAVLSLTIDTKTGLTEVISSDYTYNAVTANSSGKTVVFTQKVDTKQKPYGDTLDTDCPAFTEAIGTSLEQPPTPGIAKTSTDGLYKPTPKTLKSSNGKAEAVVSNMHLTKDITVAITPYQAENFVPMKDQIASQIVASSVTVLAGADINIANSMGTTTTAEAACLSGNMTLKASNQLSNWDMASIADAIASEELKLVVFKGKKWQLVDAEVSADQDGIHIKNASVALRLYPFVFIKAKAATNKFTVQGTVKESVWVEGQETSGQPTTYPPMVGAQVAASLPQILNSLTVNNPTDNTDNTVTIGSSAGTYTYQYSWQLFPMTSGAADFSNNLLANVSGSTGELSGIATFPLTSTVKDLMTSPGQYLLQVQTSTSLLSEQQSGLIVKKQNTDSTYTYTVKMNPTASTALTTTSGNDGSYTIPGLQTAFKSSYTLTPSKDGYTGFATSLYGDIVNGILANQDLWMHKLEATTTTSTTSTTSTTTTTGSSTTTTTTMASSNNALANGIYRVINTGQSQTIGNWSVANAMTFDGLGGWTGSNLVLADPNQMSSQGSYSIMEQLGFLDIVVLPSVPPANGGISTTGKAGVAALLGIPNQSNALFMAKMGTSYGQTDLSGDWFMVSFNPLQGYSWHDRITFNDDSSFSSPSTNYVPASGTATLSSTGDFQLPATNGTTTVGTHSCWLNETHNTVLGVQTANTTQPITVAGVKLAADDTYNVASNTGTFHLAGVVTIGTGTSAITQSRQGTITLDGVGGWSGTMMSSTPGTPTSVLVGGTYTYDGPTSPGRYTLIDTQSSPGTPFPLLCGVSADKKTTVCHYATNAQGVVGIYMGVKAASATAP